MYEIRQHNVTLSEAMANADHRIHIWDTPDLHLNIEGHADIPENALINYTFVMRITATKWHIGVSWFNDGNTTNFLTLVHDFSSWEELKEKCPQLLELEGYLYAFP